MAARKKYKFNPETLVYEVYRVSVSKRFYKGAALFLLSLAAFGCYMFIYTAYLGYKTPKTLALEQKSVELRSKLEILEHRFESGNAVLTQLQQRDNNVYRPILGMEEIPLQVRNAGFGGVSRYEHLDNSMNGKFLQSIELKMDMLYKKAYVQSRSYDEVTLLAERTGEMASCVPAIPPVQLENVRVTSHFGYRSDPFSKATTMHSGVDLAGNKGESIYATGKGKVVEVSINFFGYGNEVVIDHGFGYKTRYAHLSEFLVKEGDTVERGQIIARMGSTGKSSGTHLHYEVLYKNNRVNPMNYFDKEIRGSCYDDLLFAQTNK